MKLSGQGIQSYLIKPDPDGLGALLYGPDSAHIALRRKDLVRAFIGTGPDADLRLTRLSANDIKKDPALLRDALKERSFFTDKRLILVEDGSDTLTAPLTKILPDWQTGDAWLVITAAGLTTKSSLVKLFDMHPTARSIGLYANPPTMQEIADLLAHEGVHHIDPNAKNDLIMLSKALDIGDFRQLVHKISLYKYQDTAPLSSDDITLCAPLALESDVDDLLHAVAEGKMRDVPLHIGRLRAQGTAPVTLCIAALRHFRALHQITQPGGIDRLRPPLFGPRRERLAKQAGSWGQKKLEQALKDLIECDLILRSASRIPLNALMERTMLRLAMMVK